MIKRLSILKPNSTLNTTYSRLVPSGGRSLFGRLGQHCEYVHLGVFDQSCYQGVSLPRRLCGSLDGDDTFALTLALFLHLNVSARGTADGVDVASASTDHSADGIQRDTHLLGSVRRVQVSVRGLSLSCRNSTHYTKLLTSSSCLDF